MSGIEQFMDALRRGDKRAAARLISLVENETGKGDSIVRKLKSSGGKAYRVGITGAPGCGKSSLINGLTGLLREKRHRVGVIAVDPTSPVTGGALLGDRIRMAEFSRDAGVFIRSMATRDGTGGLAPAAAVAAAILEALGMDSVFLETTGVGQSETAVRKAVHSVVVVVPPHPGDEVQMMKAGLMEIGDIIVVNKGDLPDAEKTAARLKTTLGLLPGKRRPPVLVVSAETGLGLKKLLAALEERRPKA